MKLFVLLLLVFGVACRDMTKEKSYHEAFRNRYTDTYERHCKPLLDIAKTWTDTMIVYIYRPGDTYHGDPSCYEMENW